MRITQKYLKQKLDELDDGVLYYGRHGVGSNQYCALEFVNEVNEPGINSDAPKYLPDIRRINDAHWSNNETLTKYMLPLIVEYWNWNKWSKNRKKEVMGLVVIYTVNEIISKLPILKNEVREHYRKAKTLKEAKAAAYAYAAAAAAAYAYAADAAAAAAANAAAYAADAAYAYAAAAAAANAAAYAADAAAYAADAADAADAAAAAAAANAAADKVLIKVCKLWIRASKEVKIK